MPKKGSVAPPKATKQGASQGGIFRVGEVLSETFEIRGLLGEGGNGQVFDAQDLKLNRRVAIKAAWPSLASLGPLLRKEAQALAAIRHPALVTVYAMGMHDGIEYFVMEHVPGVTLEAHVERRRATREPITPKETLDILIAIAEGVAAVHRAGIAHRDIKPSNIMLAPPNRVVLTDFGLVTPEFEAGRPELSGTPLYMAPEALLGKVKAGAAHLVDTYALGVLAFELVTGNPPYDAESLRGLTKMHVEAPIPEVVGAPPKLAALVREMMAKDPEARPLQLESVVWRLRTIRTGLSERSGSRQLEVVVVDDDKDIAKLIKMYIRAAVPTAEVSIATGAREALEIVRAKPPHLMITDLMMPGMNGIELYMYLRGEKLAEHSTIVAVSAAARDADVELLYELGVTQFITKGPELRPRITQIAREVNAMVTGEATPAPR